MEKQVFDSEDYIAKAIRCANFYKQKGKSPSNTSKDKEESSIASWRYRQLKENKEGTLTDEKLGILNEICPYIFKTRQINREWDTVYNELEQFIERYMRLPSSDKETKYISSWLRYNIRLYKEDKLSADRTVKLRKLLPEYFGGNKEDSVLDKLRNSCTIKEEIRCTYTTEKKLIELGIKSTEQLINLIKEKVVNETGCNSDSLADKVMFTLNLKIDSESTSLVASKLTAQVVSTKINELMYNVSRLDIALAIAIFGKNKLDRDNTEKILDNIKEYKRIVFESLRKKERFLMIERYINGKTLTEVGNIWNMTTSRAGQVEIKAIKRLRHESRIQALNGDTNRLLDCLVAKSSLNKVVKLNLTYENMLNLSYLLAKIKKDNNTTCESNYILGLAYLGLLEYDINIDEALQIAEEIVADDERLRGVYDYIFMQSKENEMERQKNYSYYFSHNKVHIELFTNTLKERLGIKVETIEDEKEAETEVLDEQETEDVRKFGHIAIEEMKLSTRPFNCLKRSGCNTVHELLVLLKNDKVIKIKNLGVKSYSEILEKSKGLFEEEDWKV